jgi:uncharacterized protein
VPARLELAIVGEPMWLLASRVLYWPRERSLLLADLHLGKADTFRDAGIALPRGGTRRDLERLTRALQATGATRVVILGDLVHGRIQHAHWREEWERWRAQHRQLDFVVIGGNHDRALRGMALDIELVGEHLLTPPFELRHAPRAGVTSGQHCICGHLHPVVKLPRISGRWPCFVLGEQQTILPAFSLFTGGTLVRAPRVAVCVEDTVTLLQPRQ